VRIDSDLAEWLLAATAGGQSAENALTALVERLAARGLALARVGLSIPTLHPEIWVKRIFWTPHAGAQLAVANHEVLATTTYIDSPVARIHEGSGPIRRRLVGPGAELDFAICRDLAAEGATDYLCVPIELHEGRRTYFSLATAAPEGFPEAAIAEVLPILPLVSIWLTLQASKHAQAGLLEVYLGKTAAARVLSGEVRRGAGATTHAAVWTCDLRGFTSLSDSLPAAEVVAVLDRYFEAVAGPIVDQGGEILKFIGDAVLAIFPVGEGSRGDACRRALDAAEGALAAMSALNRTRREAGASRLDLGVALHVGEVMFGNIGARERLDFTVIGAAVNEACRIESLCKTLGTELLISAPFAAAIGEAELVSLGEHALRGVSRSQRLFTTALHAPGVGDGL
jgi:adenylate cyclase